AAAVPHPFELCRRAIDEEAARVHQAVEVGVMEYHRRAAGCRAQVTLDAVALPHRRLERRCAVLDPAATDIVEPAVGDGPKKCGAVEHFASGSVTVPCLW